LISLHARNALIIILPFAFQHQLVKEIYGDGRSPEKPPFSAGKKPENHSDLYMEHAGHDSNFINRFITKTMGSLPGKELKITYLGGLIKRAL